MIGRAFFWLGDLLAYRTTTRQRRAVAAWLVVVFSILFAFFPDAVWLVNLMSIAALFGIVTGETPVEREGE